MIADAIKVSFLTYFKYLGLYDYLALGWFFLTFFVLIILAILVAKRSSSFSLFLIILALIFFVVAPFVTKFKLNTLLRPTTTEVSSVKKLTFSDSLIVEMTLHNHAKKDFNACLVQTSIIKKEPLEGWRFYLNRLKPIANQSILVKQSLPQGETLEYKAVFDDFTYTGEIAAYINVECY